MRLRKKISASGANIINKFLVIPILVTILSVPLLGAFSNIAFAQGTLDTTDFPMPDSSDVPFGLTAGTDGNLWFTDGNNIGRMTLSGKVTEFPIPNGYSALGTITAGPDDNVWFEYLGSNAEGIAKITPDGTITEYSLPSNYFIPNDFMTDAILPIIQGSLISGPDNSLWFANADATNTGSTYYLGQITTNGTVTEHSLSGDSLASGLEGLAAGSNGMMWFTDTNDGVIGNVTTTGIVTAYPLPANIDSGINGNNAVDSDGNMWFTDGPGGFGDMAKVTPSGQITEYTLPTLSDGNVVEVSSISVGPDGNIWYTYSGFDSSGTGVGEITSGGVATNYPLSSEYGSYGPTGITNGPDGNMWFTDDLNNGLGSIVRINLSLPPVSINNGGQYTQSNKVTLGLAPPFTAAQMRISDSPFDKNNKYWPVWQRFSSSETWHLPGWDGKHTVYVQYKAANGTVSGVYSSNIVLDNIKPQIYWVSINGGKTITNPSSTNVHIYAGDWVSPITSMKVSNSNALSGVAWEPYQDSFSWSLGTSGNEQQRYVYVQVEDAAGNVSQVFRAPVSKLAQ